MGENQLKIFDRLVEMLFKFSNMEMSFNNGIKSISVVLHDNWVQYQGEPFTIDEGFELYDKEKRLKVLLDMLNVLDPGDLVRHLILDYGDEGYEEFDTRLSSALKNGHLETSESCRLRMLVLNSVSLGTAFKNIGKINNGLHFYIVALKLHQRLLRSSKSLWFDEHLSYTLCELILTSCQESKDFETGVEYGSRLAYRVDIVTMEAHTDVVKFKESWNRDFKHLDVAHHFENMLTLSTVAKNAEEYSTVALALKQAIDMFMVERLIGQEGKIATKIKSGMSSTFLSFPLEWGKEKIIMELCLALVVANELGMGNPELSFKYAQKSLEQFHLMRNDKEEVDEEKESSLHFLVGRMTYGYLLSLAGGKRIASSPPIPVLAPGSKRDLPNIKDLLEESLAYLEKAFDSAPDDDMNPSGKDGIAMQMAIIYLEQRQERKARKVLLEIGLDNSILREWLARPNQKGQKRFSNVIYSPAVLRRLGELRLDDSDDGSSDSSRLRLSRMSISGAGVGPGAKRQTRNFRDTISNHRVSRMDMLTQKKQDKITCQYCMMTCSYLDFKCNYCAQNGVGVYYCSEECMRDHQNQHALKCVKNNRQSMMLSVENLNSVVGSIMESPLTQGLFRAFKTKY